ncbi:hypothetical protein GCK72_016673 [Caenorhabditis remanei]|uniref:Uncharacterized protein n=1 Tax=Caenorhabditis remanei TaxID=31234 RepID=A0A6A5G5A3_CAERE|nr:hypothetical protein GCK72_016673 [Caenorhabditis remanei]KAF1750127.1 hypothetical protein GCK72_016673 [Caenorhabditis remanei]
MLGWDLSDAHQWHKNSTDSWLRRSWLARKLLFNWTVRNRETIRQRCQAGMPRWYGQTAPNTYDSLEYYLRLGPDTLFFILNYMALELNFLLQKPSRNYLGASTLNI